MKWVDSDKLIEHKLGKKLFEIISEYGNEKFGEIEKETLLGFDTDNVILSTGGSAVYYPEVMEYYKSKGRIIYLYCSFEMIEKRLGDFSKRGVILAPGQTLRELYDERCALYKKYADIIIDVSGTAFSTYQSRVISAISGTLNNILSAKSTYA